MDGWKIKIDGEKVVPDNYRGVLLTIPVDKGEHEIDIRFVPPGMFIGIMIGLISLLGLVMMVYSSKKCDEVRTD